MMYSIILHIWWNNIFKEIVMDQAITLTFHFGTSSTCVWFVEKRVAVDHGHLVDGCLWYCSRFSFFPSRSQESGLVYVFCFLLPIFNPPNCLLWKQQCVIKSKHFFCSLLSSLTVIRGEGSVGLTEKKLLWIKCSSSMLAMHWLNRASVWGGHDSPAFSE